jgi:2-oxoglutarate ferredoxin oxidoreductase subunit alpha
MPTTTADVDAGAATQTAKQRVTIRFAGDSGDGMQLAGHQFANISAIVGNDVSTLPNFPAEIRAPAGSIPGVSSFQLSFAAEPIHTPGDRPDVLVAMNPAALKANLADLPRDGTIVVNSDEFGPQNLKKAGYRESPLEDDSLRGYRVFEVPISAMNQRALVDAGLSAKQVNRCRNVFALGLMCWLFGRPIERMSERIHGAFSGKGDEIAAANIATLKAGHAFGETAEMFTERYRVPSAALAPGLYRNITGNAATALGFLTGARLADKALFYGSYPITPASDVLHELARFKQFGVRTFQAEDEIAAMGATVGAAFGGAVALTGTSGPGLALKGEALGMAVMTELPVIVINVQRAGPSTGMPTKTEQGDLLQAAFGRNGESPVVVLAPTTPADCFRLAIDAVRIALTAMTPVVFMTDGYLANGSEPWRVPAVDELPKIAVSHPGPEDAEGFLPYARDPETLARPWAVPGTPGLEHRLGTLEKAAESGNVSYDPENHHQMSLLRQRKVDAVAKLLPPQEVFGDREGQLAVVGWGSTYGAIRSAVETHRKQGRAVSHVHLRHLRPFPADLPEILAGFDQVLVPELNLGQLRMLLRAELLIDAQGYNRVTGQPLTISEVVDAIEASLAAAKEGGQR